MGDDTNPVILEHDDAFAEQWRERMDDATARVRALVVANPLASVASALTVGFALGRLLRR